MTLKKIAAVIGSVAVLGSSILVPLASADNMLQNNTTGPGSTNYNSVVNATKVKVENVSDMSVTNDVTTSSTTGGNSASFSTLGGKVVTGNAVNVASVQTTGNINTNSITAGPAGAGNTGINDTTGPASDQRNTIANSTDLYVRNDNTAVVKNHVVTSANTGGNVADYNTGPSDVQTGQALNVTDVRNHINDSATEIKSIPGGSGGNSGMNGITGPLSVNYNDIVNASKANVVNVNDASILNDVVTSSNTGLNSASFTTLGGMLRTGKAETDTTVDTTANMNTTSIGITMGGALNSLGSSITGPASDNRDTLVNSSDIEVVTRNNKCSSEDCKDYEGTKWGVFNRDVDVANTGNNIANNNTDSSYVESGASLLDKLVKTWFNDNFVKIQ